MLLNESFYREDAAGKKHWFYPSEVDVRYDDKGQPMGATAKADGLPVMLGGIEKMSKSKNNVVEPKDIIAKFGADTARVFTMFAGPPDQSAAWSDSRRRGLVPLPAPAVGLRREAGAAPGRPPRPRRRRSAAAAALRREMHSAAAPGEPRLRAPAIQHRGLGRDEDAQRARGRQAGRHAGRRRRAARRPSASCCARCTRRHRTSRTRCGRSWASPREHGEI